MFSALQFDGTDIGAARIAATLELQSHAIGRDDRGAYIGIDTAEGEYRLIRAGDWIVKHKGSLHAYQDPDDEAAPKERFPLFELCVICALCITIGLACLAKAIALPAHPAPLPAHPAPLPIHNGDAGKRAYARLEVSP
jgi:hypothetical protein